MCDTSSAPLSARTANASSIWKHWLALSSHVAVERAVGGKMDDMERHCKDCPCFNIHSRAL